MITSKDGATILASLDRLTCTPADLMTRFYKDLFQNAPDLKQFFHGNLPDHYHKVLDVIKLIASSVDTLVSYETTIEDMGRRHVVYGAKPSHYDAFGLSLLTTLSQSIHDWDTHDHAAWAALYAYISHTMITGTHGAEFEIATIETEQLQQLP